MTFLIVLFLILLHRLKLSWRLICLKSISHRKRSSSSSNWKWKGEKLANLFIRNFFPTEARHFVNLVLFFVFFFYTVSNIKCRESSCWHLLFDFFWYFKYAPREKHHSHVPDCVGEENIFTRAFSPPFNFLPTLSFHVMHVEKRGVPRKIRNARPPCLPLCRYHVNDAAAVLHPIALPALFPKFSFRLGSLKWNCVAV